TLFLGEWSFPAPGLLRVQGSVHPDALTEVLTIATVDLMNMMLPAPADPAEVSCSDGYSAGVSRSFSFLTGMLIRKETECSTLKEL
ncbi:hypothetical protein KUCAC02_006465, partial [Chaenocephalus aceratus]